MVSLAVFLAFTSASTGVPPRLIRGRVAGLEKLRAASFAVVDTIAASRDFAYILVYARHVFRGYPELKAQVAANDAKDQERVLACINEGIKAGEVRTDIDPVSAAVSLIGGTLRDHRHVDRVRLRLRSPRDLRRPLGRLRAHGRVQALQIARGQGRGARAFGLLLPPSPGACS